MTTQKMSNIDSLYIHIPFCKHICYYCDFIKVIYNQKMVDNYLKSLFLQLKDLKNRKFKTIYIGGGTPSCLNNKDLDILLSFLSKHLKKKYEFSIECNIEDINDTFLLTCANNKINRLSIGVQTFNENLIKIIGRNHNQKMVFENVNKAKKYIDNISIDMIYALPTQDLDMLKQDVELAMKLPINHISYYSLILEKNTILYNQKYEEIDDFIQAKMYRYIYTTLKKHGFNRYEISNFAKKNYKSKHNLTYWHNEHYLAYGISGSGYIDNIRYTNIKNMSKYIQNNFEKENVVLNKNDIEFEEIMLRLRLDEGINIRKFNQKFDVDFINKYKDSIDFLTKNKLLRFTNNKKVIKTTLKGSLLLNEVLLYF